MSFASVPKTARVRGRPFTQGNRGRPAGAKNRSTLVRGVLLRGDDERLLRKAIEMALNGDAQILKFFLGRILPRERVILLDLPKMEFADDATEALGVITSAVCEGKITPGEGASLTGLVNSFAHAVYMADLVKRLEALEAKINGTA